MFPIATTYSEMNANDDREASGAVGSLIAGMQSPTARTSALPDIPAAETAAGNVPAVPPAEQAGASWTSLADRLQQEAGRAELAQQHLAAQQQAAEHLGALKGAAHGGGLRVQVVGGQAAQW